MKIQCSCGAKYAFDVTPEQARQPVKFICPACGLDSSDFVNQLIRQELAQDTASVARAVPGAAPAIEVAPPPPAVATTPAPMTAEPPAPLPPVSPPRVRLHQGGEKATEAATARSDQRFCLKHPGQRLVETCAVCGRPICPKCMELFGYLCSAACRGKAELQGIAVPVFAGQKALVEQRRWRKIGLATAGVGVLVAALLGAWVWYAWVGTRPRTTYAVRFTEPAYAGAARRCGENQIVFLHGGTLARHDLKTKKEIWSRPLLDPKKVEQDVDRQIKEMQARKAKLDSDNPEFSFNIPPRDKLLKWAVKSAMASLELRVHGQNVWVRSPEKIARHDWDTGQVAQEILLTNRFGGLIARGDEWLIMEARPGRQVITHISLATGQTRDEEIALPASVVKSARPAGPGGRAAAGREMAGLPVGVPGRDAGKPLDPARVSEQASHLSLPGRIALPAVLSINRNQERAMAELQDNPRPPQKPAGPLPAESFMVIPASSGCVQFAARLIEERLVTRAAMKAPPKKSALDRAPSVANTVEIANEILNEIQRDRGGDTVTEDESRYQVVIRCPSVKDAPDWSGEVIGPPALFPLATVNVLTAGKTLTVLDKQNRQLWSGALNNPLNDLGGALDEADAPYGLGPCVERAGRLYVFDQGTLSAFDLKTGTVHWRLPSVGITGLFFDDAGLLYINTTTAGHESLKYSRQMDISQKVGGIVIKVDPQTGQTLWASSSAGAISYLSGPYIYSVQSHRPMDEDEESPYTVKTGFETPAYLRIKRINPRNGQEMWEHYQPRAPLDVQFDRNFIHIVFKKEVQVLTYLSF